MSEEDISDDDEDWFERALRDEESSQMDEASEESPQMGEASEESDSNAWGGDETAVDQADDTVFGGQTREDTDGSSAGRLEDSGVDTDNSSEAVESVFGDEETDGEDSPWGTFTEGQDPESSSDTPESWAEGQNTKSSGDTAESWADETATADDSLFGDDDFETAFETAGGDVAFEESDFESDIPRIDTGIDGLDEMIQGGIPERHLIVAIGGAGTGKTTFGMQFLHHGLTRGENAVFITLEQSHESILSTANELGWDFETYEDRGMLAVVDLDPVEMANSLENIQAELPTLIEDFGADRLVLDSVSLLEMMYDDQARRRTEVFDFTRALKRAGVTTFLTSEASESNPYASRHGIIEYLTDAVFVLLYIRGETQETRLAVEIQKIRNANHSREKKPYELTDQGISVYRQANIF